MTWREKNYSSIKGLFALRDEFNVLLSEKYDEVFTNNKPKETYYVIEPGKIVRTIAMYNEQFEALALEYSDSVLSAELYDTEEGDLFPIDEYSSKEDLFNNMFKEIEG